MKKPCQCSSSQNPKSDILAKKCFQVRNLIEIKQNDIILNLTQENRLSKGMAFTDAAVVSFSHLKSKFS